MKAYFTEQWLRNQMGRGLWIYLSSIQSWGDTTGIPKMPKVFRSRVKKLLNIDRVMGVDEGSWVFYESAGGGTGTQECYSDFHVFMMGIALQMLNIGFKQSEIIFFLQHTKKYIREHYIAIRASGKIAPICGAKRQRCNNAISYFMLINRIEIKELWNNAPKAGPVILEPTFVEGLDEMQKEISRHPTNYTTFIAIELADMAITLPEILNTIPATRRGRPAA